MPHTSSDAPSALRAREGDFAAYATADWPRLVRTAHLLTGDLHEAEDLALTTLARARARWRRIPRDDVAFHVRRALVARHLVRARRRRVVLLLTALLPGRAPRPVPDPVPDRAESAGGRSLPHRALAALPARRRAVVVLRYGEGLSEAETAQLLGCSAGSVRTHARRGLKALSADPSLPLRSLRHPVIGARP